MKTTKCGLSGLFVLAFAVATFVRGFSAQAQSVALDPVKDFLSSSDLGARSEIERANSALEMSIDLAGRGKPCVLLALPSSYVKRGGYSWTVYIPIKGGYVQAPLSDDGSAITCYPDRIYLGPIPEVGVRRGLVTFTISHGSGGIDAYWLQGKKIVHKEILEFPFPEEAGNPDGSITSVPMLLRYFPRLAKPYTEGKDLSHRLSFDDLRARGYIIPQAHED